MGGVEYNKCYGILPTSAATSPLLEAPPKRTRRSILFYCFVFLAGAASVAFAQLLFSSYPSSPSSSVTSGSGAADGMSGAVARPLERLRHPVVILVSADGFRFGYHLKTSSPNIRRLIAEGTMAAEGLIPVYPSLTFPNHYTIVTGLYPESHGIVSNYFVDPVSGEAFTTRSHEPYWWLGEPLWETAANQGLGAAAVFWAGAEVAKGAWSSPPHFCPEFNASVPFEDRVDTVLGYFDIPKAEIPSFVALYLDRPDKEGHLYGPDDPRITEAVTAVDQTLGRLMSGLEERRILNDVTLIFLGDHGMAGTCEKRRIFVQDFAPWIEIPEAWVEFAGPLLALRPPANVSLPHVAAKMKEALASGKVPNGEYIKVYLKEELPKKLHYSDNYRIPPIIGIIDEGFLVEWKQSEQCGCGGNHGYDNSLFSMRTMFVARGPQFKPGRKVPSFRNLEIYNLVTTILGLNAAPNNGTPSFPSSLLLPRR